MCVSRVRSSRRSRSWSCTAEARAGAGAGAGHASFALKTFDISLKFMDVCDFGASRANARGNFVQIAMANGKDEDEKGRKKNLIILFYCCFGWQRELRTLWQTLLFLWVRIIHAKVWRANKLKPLAACDGSGTLLVHLPHGHNFASICCAILQHPDPA